MVADSSCDPSVCNHEGLCTLMNGQPTCKCIGSAYFAGLKCGERIDNCQSDPCRNGASCTNGLGQYYCDPCGMGFGGQQCSVAVSNLFTKWHLLFNRIGAYGESHVFLATVESLGQLGFSYELNTDTVCIEALETQPTGAGTAAHWHLSENLPAIAVRLNLHHANLLPYRSGYYHISRARFWSVGQHNVSLLVYDTKSVSKMFVMESHALQIPPPPDLECVPLVRFPHCSNPNKPLFVDIARYNNFEPIVHKRCFSDSTMSYRWLVMNIVDTVQLHYFEKQNSILLKVPPYKLWFNYHGSVMQSYQIRLEVSETVRSMRVRSMARCYIFVMTKPVTASIRGGPKRETSFAKPCQLDGSASRDYAISPSLRQDMIYRWDCASETDPQNANCRPNLGNNEILLLDPGSLRLSMSYRFTLTVTSKVNIFSTHNTSQLDSYRTGQEIHLMAECLNCEPTSKLTYKWIVEDFQVGDAKRLLYTPNSNSKEISKVAVNLELNCVGGATGKATLILSANQAPTGGSCTVNPTSGVEYETEFLIECQQFQDSQPPLTYEMRSAEGIWLSRSSDASTKCRLPFTQSLTLLVCDNLRSCSEPQTLPVSIAPLRATDNGMQLKASLTELRSLWEAGDMSSAMVLTNSFLGKESTVDVTELVLEHVEEMELRTVLAVEQFARITRNLLEPMRPIDHEKAALFTKFFAKLSRGFENVLNDGEIKELDQSSYTAMSTDLANILREFSEPMEQMPEIQNHMPTHRIGQHNNMIAENYPDMDDFDDTVLVRINNWLEANTELYRCLHLIGKTSTFQHEPSESPLEISKSALKWIAYSIEENTDRQWQTLENVVNISMSSHNFKEFMTKLKYSHISMQIELFANGNMNPYWWFPDKESLSTGVFGFSVFSPQFDDDTIQLTNPIAFDVVLQKMAAISEQTESIFEGVSEMLTFSTTINAGAMLVVRFNHTDIDLKVILQIGDQPRSYQFRKMPKTVNASNIEDAVFYLHNTKSLAEKAFLSLRPFHRQNSDVSWHHPASFKFTQEVRECLSWNHTTLPDPQWSSVGCMVTPDNRLGTSLRCACYHLSTFAGKVFSSTPASVQWDRDVLESVALNWVMCLFFIILLLIGSLIIARGLRDLRRHNDFLTADFDEEYFVKEGSMLVIFTTGNQWNAGSSANIWLSFKLWHHGQRTFVIQQNPAKPQLVPNSKCYLRLPLSLNDLAHPLDIVIRHDNAGRYASWFCSTITMQDTSDLNETQHIFEVHQWITTKPIYLRASDGSYTPNEQPNKFRRNLEAIFLQWFQLEAVMGPWSIQQNRYERSCIFVVKIAICICVTACFYGDTTVETYEKEREMYESVILNPWQTLKIGLVSYGVAAFVELALRLSIGAYIRNK